MSERVEVEEDQGLKTYNPACLRQKFAKNRLEKGEEARTQKAETPTTVMTFALSLDLGSSGP